MKGDKQLEERIEQALSSIRDYLQSDGGDVRLHQIREDMVVEVELMGNCVTCSISSMTMKAGIERAIKQVAPEVISVTAINA